MGLITISPTLDETTSRNFDTLASEVNGNLEAANLKTGAVTSDKILDGTIVNADLAATAGIVPSKLATGSFQSVRSSGTNTAFGNAFTTVESVAITLTYASLVMVYGSCDARVADTTVRSCRSKIVSTTSAVDTDRSGVVTQVTSAISSGRTQYNAGAAFGLSAGSHTIKLRLINDTDGTSVTTDNSHIEVIAVPNV